MAKIQKYLLLIIHKYNLILIIKVDLLIIITFAAVKLIADLTKRQD